jgi:hypothetical protein
MVNTKFANKINQNHLSLLNKMIIKLRLCKNFIKIKIKILQQKLKNKNTANPKLNQSICPKIICLSFKSTINCPF